MSHIPLVDTSFALSQLSGNKELMLKMFARFQQEYLEVSDRVAKLIAQKDLQATRQLVHTLKGVAGNLGINALHHACKALEDAIRADEDISTPLHTFYQTVQRTLNEIDGLVNKTDTPESTHATESNAEPQKSRDALLTCLQQNKFIPPDKLNSLLNGLDISAQQKQQLKVAVDELDYPAALSLLKQIPE